LNVSCEQISVLNLLNLGRYIALYLYSKWGNRRGGDHWGDLGLDEWIILGWISRRCDVVIWTG